METHAGKGPLDLATVVRVLRSVDPVGGPVKDTFDPTVVFLLLFDPRNPHILAVLKSDTEGYPWANQVALPGGHVDTEDATTLDAAFRELQEEVNIHRENVRFIGPLGHFQTIANKDIEVFTGVWNGRGELKFDAAEIARVVPVPVSALFRVHMARGYHGRIPGVHELVYPVEGVRIWGVTGKILHFFLEQLCSAFFSGSSAFQQEAKIIRRGV